MPDPQSRGGAGAPGNVARLEDLRTARPRALSELGDTLRAYHRFALEPYWPAIRARVDSDTARRRQALREEGVHHLLATFHPMMRRRFPALTSPATPPARRVGGRAERVAGSGSTHDCVGERIRDAAHHDPRRPQPVGGAGGRDTVRVRGHRRGQQPQRHRPHRDRLGAHADAHPRQHQFGAFGPRRREPRVAARAGVRQRAAVRVVDHQPGGAAAQVRAHRGARPKDGLQQPRGRQPGPGGADTPSAGTGAGGRRGTGAGSTGSGAASSCVTASAGTGTAGTSARRASSAHAASGNEPRLLKEFNAPRGSMPAGSGLIAGTARTGAAGRGWSSVTIRASNARAACSRAALLLSPLPPSEGPGPWSGRLPGRCTAAACR